MLQGSVTLSNSNIWEKQSQTIINLWNKLILYKTIDKLGQFKSFAKKRSNQCKYINYFEDS